MAKVIFLDVDGVLNSSTYIEKCWKKTGNSFFCYQVPFDVKCVKRLAKLVKKTDAMVVLSSTWRLDKISMEIVAARLYEYGVIIEDKTPFMNSDRGYEILSWLKQNPSISVDDVLIIDDDIEDIVNVFPERNIVKTNFRTGFSYLNYLEAKSKLLGNTKLLEMCD